MQTRNSSRLGLNTYCIWHYFGANVYLGTHCVHVCGLELGPLYLPYCMNEPAPELSGCARLRHVGGGGGRSRKESKGNRNSTATQTQTLWILKKKNFILLIYWRFCVWVAVQASWRPQAAQALGRPIRSIFSTRELKKREIIPFLPLRKKAQHNIAKVNYLENCIYISRPIWARI